jgi:Leucine-rich repeat (LRR) protein
MIHPNALSGLPSVITLDLSGNLFVTIDPNFFNFIPMLELFTMARNPLTALTSSMLPKEARFYGLVFQKCRIESLDLAFENFNETLNAIDLNTNRITSIPIKTFRNLGRLIALDLSANLITSIEPSTFRDLTSLNSLKLHYNLLTELSADLFLGLQALSVLVVGANLFTQIPNEVFHPLTHLAKLSLDQSPIQSLTTDHFEYFQSLEYLTWSEVQMTKIEAGLFANLTRLQFLNLQGGNILEVASNSFPSQLRASNFVCQGSKTCDPQVYTRLCGPHSICRGASSVLIPEPMCNCSCQVGYSGMPCAPINSCTINNGGCIEPNTICNSTGPATNVCLKAESSASSFAPAIGAAVGGVAVVIILIIVVIFVMRRRRSAKSNLQPAQHSGSTSKKPQSGREKNTHAALAPLEIPRENITLVREIGHGEFGVVMEASAVGLPGAGRSKGVATVAVKLMKDKSESAHASFADEALRLQPLEHVNVCRLLAVCFESEPRMIVLEFMCHGDLKQLLRDAKGQGSLQTGHLLRIGRDVSRGFAYLQRVKYVHRDIAARNVLIGDGYVAKLSDFGMARRVYAKEVWAVMLVAVR